MIHFKEPYFYLTTKNTSYVMRIFPDGTLQHVYYGGKVSEDDFSYYNHFRERIFSPKLIEGDIISSHDNLPQECPTFGRGDYRSAALKVQGKDGRFLNELKYKSYEVMKGKPQIPGMPQLDVNVEDVETLAITLVDEIVGFEVVLYYSIFENADVISRTMKVVNTSDSAVQIRSIASLSVDFETADFDFISLQGAWARERYVSRRELSQGSTSVESRRGSSSHQMNPFVALAGKQTNENQGHVYGFTLIYSGDFKGLAEVDQFDNTRLQLGINPETFSWKLEAGESFIAPESLMTYAADGLNHMSQNFHQVCRNHLGRSADKTIKHPIVINNWEATYFDLSDEVITEFISNCQGLGIDTFVLDDGWFGKRDDCDCSLGDWVVDRAKFKNGLHNVVNHCHACGMKFGIWFEPEMISRRSHLFEIHPDWCIHCDNADAIESRTQLVLDMSRPEVVDNIYDQMANIINEYGVEYIKWDFNRNLTDNGSNTLPVDQQLEHTHRYVLGVYSLMQRLWDNFPHVFFEGCSGGGGRFDFGILYYMTQIWTSDDTDAIERLKIQYGTSYVYPPSSMSAHVSACPNHQTGRSVPFDTRGEVAQMCNYGYEFDIGKLSEDEKEKIRIQIQDHRKLDELVQSGTYFRLVSPFENDYCAWEMVSEDKKKAYVSATFKTAFANPNAYYLQLQGLEPTYKYYVKQLDMVLGGDTLMNAGVPLLLNDAEEYVSKRFDFVMV